jgi:hypothetical protein
LPAGLHFGDRARAFLKVQEGCRLACSYCIVPRVRGASRSVPAEDVQRAALELFRSGYREIVLTGVNTGDWGIDLSPPADLSALLRRLLEVCGPNRIRLNSLEPLAVTDAVIELMAADPRLAPHLQVPLQSASGPILRLMRRNYRLETYRERLERLRAAVPHAGLGADVIVGHPGEGEAQFFVGRKEPADYSGFLEQDAALVAVIRLDKKPTSRTTLRMGCGYPCGSNADITRLLEALPTDQWVRVSFDLECFADGGLDVENVDTPLLITTKGELALSLAEVSVVPEAGRDATIRCRD